MRRILLSFLLISIVVLAAHGEDLFVAEGVSDGKTMIWFTTETIDTVFEGTMDVTGTLVWKDAEVVFTAFGDSHGAGVADGFTLVTDLWILFAAEGETENGDAVGLRGGMSIRSEDVNLDTLALGTSVGTFFFIVDLPGESVWVSGDVTSSASGNFVVPDDPLAMQVEGIGLFALEGTPTAPEGELADQLPWNTEGWPTELNEELIRLLAGLDEEVEPTEEDEPAP